jgi:hypothetical protein
LSGNNLTEQEIRAFVGSRADYYFGKWRAALEGSGKGTGFNWAAFFLSGLWLPYRKMYLATGILYGIILLESTLEEVVFVGILRKSESPPALDRVVGIAVAIICGAFGNRWYLSHTRKGVAQLRVQSLPEDSYLQALSKRGGTNIAASLGCFIIFLVAAFLIVYLLDLALGIP